MINFLLVQTGLMELISPMQSNTYTEALMYNDVIITMGFMGAFMTWFLAGDLIKTWVMAWWKGCEVAVEWTKARSWKFHLAQREKGHDDFRTLPDGRPIEMRRAAVGTGPHKVQMFMFTSEFGAVVSPTEIEGERYYKPTDIREGTIFNDEFIQAIPFTESDIERYTELEKGMDDPAFKEEHQEEFQHLQSLFDLYNKRKLYVRYPNSSVTPDEFVKFQTINTDPSTTESYSEFRELETKAEMMNGWSQMQEFLPYLVPILIALAIAYQLFGQQNIASGIAGDLHVCTKDLGTCISQCSTPIFQGSKDLVNTTMGGAIK